MSATAPGRTSRYAWYVAGMLSLAYLMSVMDRYLLSVVLDDLKANLQLTDTQLGILQGPSFVVLYLVASIPLGRLADLTSRRLLIAGGLAIWSLATATCGLANTFPQLLAARFAVGLGEAALLPCAMSLISSYFAPDKLSRGLAIYSMGGSFGRVAAFSGGGAVLTAFTAQGGLNLFGLVRLAPWQAVFVTGGLLGLSVSLLFLLTVREPARLVGEGETNDTRAALAHFWVRRWAYLSIFIPYSMVAGMAGQLAAWTISFYGRTHDLPVGQAASLVGLTGLVFGPVGHLFGGWLNDFLRARGVVGPQPLVLTGALVLSTAFTAIFTLASSVSTSAIAFGVAYFLLCAAGPTGYSGAQSPTPHSKRGFISSLLLVFYMALGMGLGPLVVGVLGDFYLRDEQKLGQAILLTSLLLTAVAVPFSLFGFRSFTRAVEDNERTNPTLQSQ